MGALAILLVEDNPGDAYMIRDALDSAGYANSMQVVEDGAAALNYLTVQAATTESTYPDLILLDLHMPGMDGCETLTRLKSDPRLRRIPVVVFSGTEDPEEIRATYKLHANCFVTKPNDPDALVAVSRSIHRFWSSVAQFPRS